MNKYNLTTSAQLPYGKMIYADLIGNYKNHEIKSPWDNKVSGIWTDHITTTTEDQYKFAVPLNRDTEKLYYNQRIIIDNKVLSEPR